MCCFTQPVEHVAGTRIFARARGDMQTLVYSMTYSAMSELAMVLPLPVPPDSPEDALDFVDLESCAGFFEELREGFRRAAPARELLSGGAASLDLSAPLRVVDVGRFEASFVPRPLDFGRLDERFRLPAELWLKLGIYADWGFAVFKLKATAGDSRVHPMAFRFPRRDRRRLFFPTVHIHDGHLAGAARFDHELYCQPEPATNWHLHGWEESLAAARRFMHCEAASQVLDPVFPVWRMKLEGALENVDTWIGPGSRIPAAAADSDLPPLPPRRPAAPGSSGIEDLEIV
jgi:hypothetical protein